MAEYIKTLKEDNGDITYPVTQAGAVLLTGGGDLETTLNAKATQTAVDGKISVGDVRYTDMTANSVRTAAIQDLNVTTGKIANGAITGAANNASSVGSTKLALATVGTPNLRDSAVSTAKVANGAITTAKIKTNGTWTTGTYASGYKASTNAGYLQSIQACIYNGFLIIRFGVSKTSGNFTANSEVTIGTIPATIDGVNVSTLVSGSGGKSNVYRANLSGASNAMGFCQLNGLNISVNPSASAGWVAGQMMIPLNW